MSEARKWNAGHQATLQKNLNRLGDRLEINEAKLMNDPSLSPEEIIATYNEQQMILGTCQWLGNIMKSHFASPILQTSGMKIIQ